MIRVFSFFLAIGFVFCSNVFAARNHCDILNPSEALNPVSGDSFVAVSIREGEHGGTIHRTKMTGNMNRGTVMDLSEKYPEHMARRGYAKISDDIYEHPDAIAFNNSADHMKSIGDPLAPQVRVKVYDGLEDLPTVPYAEDLSNGIVNIAKDGRFRFHDVNVHLHGYSVLPKKTVDAVKARLKAFLDMYKDPKLAKHKDDIFNFLELELNKIDRLTNDISINIVNGRSNSLAGNLEMLNASPHTLLTNPSMRDAGFVSGFKRLPEDAQDIIRGHLKTNETSVLSKDTAKAQAKNIMRHVKKPSKK